MFIEFREELIQVLDCREELPVTRQQNQTISLRACANKLADVFSSILKLSLSQSNVPSCFKTTIIVIRAHIQSSIPTLYAVEPGLHYSISHVETLLHQNGLLIIVLPLTKLSPINPHLLSALWLLDWLAGPSLSGGIEVGDGITSEVRSNEGQMRSGRSFHGLSFLQMTLWSVVREGSIL